MNHNILLLLDKEQEKKLSDLFAYYRSVNPDLSDNDIFYFIFNSGLANEHKIFSSFQSYSLTE